MEVFSKEATLEIIANGILIDGYYYKSVEDFTLSFMIEPLIENFSITNLTRCNIKKIKLEFKLTTI